MLLTTGLVAGLTGQLDWSLFGHPVAGERFPFVLGLAASALALRRLGRWTELEYETAVFTGIAALGAFLTAPISFEHLSPGWIVFQSSVWIAHVGLCAQLAAWAGAARKAHGVETLGVAVMAAGMACEAFVIFPVAQLVNVDAACAAGMHLTCVSGSPFVAIALPLCITLALVVLWLNPLERRLRGGRRGH